MGIGAKAAAAFLLLPALGAEAREAPVLNELVVRPAGNEGEWIEIANPGDRPCSLEGWAIRDGTSRSRRLPASARLGPGGFLVLAARPESLRTRFAIPDSIPVVSPDGWPVLNDHDAAAGLPADVLVLVGASGEVVDSLAYFESWIPVEPGRSLERVDPDAPAVGAGSWGWCDAAVGATPGRVNSLAALAPDPESVWSGPPVADPRRAPAVFRYRVPEPGRLGVWLVDPDDGSAVLLQEPVPAPAAGIWVWGPGLPGARRPGLHFVCLRWQGDSARVRRCCPVWVAS